MRGVLIFAVLLGAVAGYRPPSYAAALQSLMATKDGATEEPTKETSAATISAATATAESLKPTTTQQPASTTAVTAQTSSTAASSEYPPSEEIAGELPVSLGPPLLPEDEREPPQRRVVTYDQRQEGQYNIRADLENFMIVLIPPSPAEGLNLLDLLSKSSVRRSSHGSKSKRKHYGSAVAVQAAPAKFRQAIKGDPNLNYLSRQPLGERGQNNLAQQIAIIEGGGGEGIGTSTSLQRLPEFIEGRTPYHVDISSSNQQHHSSNNNNNEDELAARQQPDRQVDVLPPPYPPIGYQHHLIKPFHLDAEPTVIQALPPPELLNHQSNGASGVSSSGNFLETYNQLLAASGLQSARNELNSNTDSGGYYRVSRAIRGDNFLDSNRLTSSASNSRGGGAAGFAYPLARRTAVPFYRADLSFGASSLYPPIDVPHLLPSYVTSNARNFELNSDADDEREQRLEDAHIGEIIVQPPSNLEDDLDLDLHGGGISFIDAESKALLSDGLERCAPGRRRDSYGVCREIEGY